MSPSWLDVVEQRIDPTHDGHLLHHHSTIGHAPSGQDSMRSTLQSLLASDFLNQHDMVNNGYKEIMRICIKRILESFPFQSEATSKVEGGTWDCSTDLQAPFAFQHLQGQISDQAYDPLSVNTLPERADHHLFHQLSPDLSFSQTSSSDNYELGVQPFQLYIPEAGMCSEGQTLSDSSASRHQQLRLPIIQGGLEKVKCTWDGCLSVLNEGSHARHVNEIHLKKVRDVCTSCGRAFPRMHMKKNHVCHGPLSRRRRS